MSGFGEPWNGTRMCGPGEGRGQSRAMEGHEQKPMLSKSGFFHCLAETRRCHLFRSICSPRSLFSRLSGAGLKTLGVEGGL